MNRMQQWMTGVFVSATALVAAVPAQPADDRAAGPAALLDIQQRGRQLYLHERALAAAFQRAHGSATFRADARVVTAVTEQSGDTRINVIFVDDGPAALYRVEIDVESNRPGPLDVFARPARLDRYARQALAARTQALAAGVDTCGRDPRIIVLPDDSAPGRWQVYMLPQAQDGESIPVGGSHRIDTDGRAVLAQHAVADTCITLDRGPQSIGVMVAAMPGEPAPSEAHVFWSLWAALPMYVGTDTGLWSINDGAIEPPTALNALRRPDGFEAPDDHGLLTVASGPSLH